MKSKKIIIITLLSIFLLISLTALSVTGIKTQKEKENSESDILETKYKYSFAKVDGEVFQSYGTAAVSVRGINNFFIAKDIVVSGKVPFSLTVDYEFLISPFFGPDIIYEQGDSVELHINTILFPSIGTQCTEPYINSISGAAFGLTVYESL